MVADDGDIERHLTKISTENSDAPMAGGGPGGAGNGGGWKQLKDEKATGTAKLARVRSGDSSKRAGSDDAEVTIEMELGATPGSATGGAGAGAIGADGASAMSVTAAASERVYKVYKRRWFGLVELVLLNIVASWDWLTFSPVASQAAAYFKTDETAVNWFSTCFMFANVFVAPAVIYALHLGPKLSISTSAALLLVGNWLRYAGCHSSESGIFGLVMFGQILTGAAQAFVLAAPTRYSDLWFTNRGRVGATALASLANPFGAALGQLIIPFWVQDANDVSSMVLYVSIIATVCSLPAFFIPSRPPTPAAPSSVTPKLSLRASVRVLASRLEFWLLFFPFAVYVGLFNSISTILNQVLLPYGYSEEEAGIAGAILIVVGLVVAAAVSPVIDRTKAFLPLIRVAVPVAAVAVLLFVWMPETRDGGGVAGPYLAMALLGAAAFSLLPVAVEFLVEVTHPVSPEVTSVVSWSAGQLLGGVFIIISGALKSGEGAEPPNNMKRALVFSAVIAVAVVPLPLCLGMFGRKEQVKLRRVVSDEAVGRAPGVEVYRDADSET